MSILPELICKYNIISVKIPSGFSGGTQLLIKVLCKEKSKPSRMAGAHTLESSLALLLFPLSVQAPTAEPADTSPSSSYQINLYLN